MWLNNSKIRTIFVDQYKKSLSTPKKFRQRGRPSSHNANTLTLFDLGFLTWLKINEDKNHDIQMGLRDLQDILNANHKTLSNSSKKLEKFGFLFFKKGQGRSKSLWHIRK